MLLTVKYWQETTAAELKSLIQRFSTRERNCVTAAKPSFVWRDRRLEAVSIFQQRFGSVPEVFTHHKLPVMPSYYMKAGEYIWRLKAQHVDPSDTHSAALHSRK